MAKSNTECDVLIIGSGLAALTTALKLAEADHDHSQPKKIILITKNQALDANSSLAQGGIASVAESSDSIDSHIEDTIVAGCHLNDSEAVRNYISQAPDRILDLLRWGVKFDSDLTREGGHSARRVHHFGDHTGEQIQKHLWARIQEQKEITVLTDTFAIDIIVDKQADPKIIGPTRAIGVYALDKKNGIVCSYTAPVTILATGGAGKVYLYTSSWSGATGDGIAMAYRAGARISNLEFMQFHPTCLFHQDARNFLITEAMRGEGAKLIDNHGREFMTDYHPLGALAPRDIVARSIDAEMKKSGAACVYLDISHKPPEFIKLHFPMIYSKCLSFGIDITKQPIPVVPAAHYLCGGVITDINGNSDIRGLYVLGESACTGLHGANRLASNSLLECMSMAHNAHTDILKKWTQYKNEFNSFPTPALWEKPEETNSDEMIVITHMWEEIRRLMWNYVGIVRSNKRLERAEHRLDNILIEVKEYYSHMKIHSDILELRNIAIVAKLTVECALKRRHSIGIHYSLDYPEVKDGRTLKPLDQNTLVLRGLN